MKCDTMTLMEFLYYQAFFVLTGLLLYSIVRKQSDYHQSDTDDQFGKLVLYGFLGWILAFLRIIIIQIYQLLLLIQAGVDIADTDAIQNAAITSTYAFNIIGPLLSGLFEEIIRYWLLFKILGDGRDYLNRKYFPVIFGFAWAYSEILILTLGFIGIGPISLENLIVSGYERVIAALLHISLTYLVVYAKFDNKKSLYLAIILHTVINLILFVLVFEVGLATFGQIVIVEAVLTVLVIGAVIFIYSWINKMEDKIDKAGQ